MTPWTATRATHQRIPRARTQAYAIVAHAQAADAILVAHQRPNLFAPGNVPNLRGNKSVSASQVAEPCGTNLAFEIVVAGEQQSSGNRRGDGCDAAKDRLGLSNARVSQGCQSWHALVETHAVDVQLAIRADIEQSAGGVVGAGDERVAIGEKLNGVDVGLVAGKGLDSLAGANVPQLGESIARARNEGVLVGRVEADAHDVAEVVGELGNFLARLDVPLHAGHVTRRSQYGAIIDEATAGEVTGMARELAGDSRRAVALLVEVVDGADIVQTAARDEITAGGVGAGHDPGRSQGYRVDLVGGVGVPDDELAILGGGNEMPPVRGPVHGVNLGQMALERAFSLHELVLGDGLMRLLGNRTN